MPTIDAHHHVWDLTKTAYPWLDAPAWQKIKRNFDFDELRRDLVECGIQKTILVQANNGEADSAHAKAVALAEDMIAGFVGWVPLLEPDKVEARLDELAVGAKLVGIRHVLGLEADNNWVLRPEVLRSLSILEKRGLAFDLNCDHPAYLAHAPTLAEKFPTLHIVVNHIGKPPIGARGWEPWASDITRAAACPNVFAKLSGLTTPFREGWTGEDFRPYVEHAVEQFGAQRIMYASNWPVTLVAGSYRKQWDAINLALGTLSQSDTDAIYGETAMRCYRLGS